MMQPADHMSTSGPYLLVPRNSSGGLQQAPARGRGGEQVGRAGGHGHARGAGMQAAYGARMQTR